MSKKIIASTESDSQESSGLLRLKTVLKLIPVSPATWWAGVREGRFPQPIRLGPHTTCWRARDILALIENGAE
jgi:prophage regulatory protein